MIVPMKEVTLLVSRPSRSEAVKTLGKLGVLHIHPVSEPASEEIAALQRQQERLEQALRLLPEDGGGRKQTGSSPEAVIEKILAIKEEEGRIAARQEELRVISRWYEAFGRVSPADVEHLAEKGVYIRFYAADTATFKRLTAEHILEKAGEEHGTVYFALISDNPDDKLDLKENHPPEMEYSRLIKEQQSLKKEADARRSSLIKLTGERRLLRDYAETIRKQLEFHAVLDGMGDAEEVMYLKGFCPAEKADELTAAADRAGWACLLSDPENPDEVPTLIHKPRWLRIIDPMFSFMGTVPGYNEFDISFWFLLFFSIFFAMLIGDAGYGLLFMGITFLASRKMKTAPRQPFQLFFVLSGTTVIWGVITGTWFGYQPIGRLGILNHLVIDQIDSFADDNSLFIMYLCFIIGVVQLSVAHVLKGLKIINSPRALSELGWVGLLVSIFFLAGNLVLNKPLPGFFMPLLIASAALTLIFAHFQKNIIKGILLSIGDLPLSLIGSFSDVVSYLRLFAVGYASVMVAVSFNDMARELGLGSVLSGLMMALILLLGHGLNILLGLMAVIVHGVRLNMLEFSGQLDMQWAGRPYAPFKE